MLERQKKDIEVELKEMEKNLQTLTKQYIIKLLLDQNKMLKQ